MDIIVDGALSIQKDLLQEDRVFPFSRKPNRKDRRKNKYDRRRSVREGIYISLSGTKERRILPDRRRNRS